MGRRTLLLIAALVVFETAAAWLLSGQPVWLILLARAFGRARAGAPVQ